MKTLVAVLSAVILAGGQQLVDPYDGLLQWQSPLGPGLLNPYAVPHPLQQFVPSQPPFLGGRQLPPVPVPFPAQYPVAGQFPASYPLPLPVPQQPLPVPPFTNFQPPMQVVRHGLPYSDAAAVSYSSLGYGNNAQVAPAAVNGQVRLPSVTLQAPPTVNVATQAQPAGVSSTVGVPVPATGVPSVVKDIASFGSGTDKSGPVARYEAINAGSVHVAPLPGHTVDQKLIAPGTTEQKL
ncbi:uncharacterized protein LOC131208098 [Anopheles bellator]|uniref:uncharacterized protein LOC131208098 n=1 Tax=Anopheles bellator TaxID=139047 RepID=UPI00264A215E|nr:uncharacterized protein LOC131208098 [Anopheles bellator]